jgi:rubrerythrin
MTDQNLNLVDAIHIAMKAEQKAAAFYADASQKTTNLLGQRLFEQLAEFERHHYDKLAALEKSLRDEGAFIGYEGVDPSFPVPGEVEGVAGIEEANKKTAMGIITMALDVEREAEERYAGLAEQTTDPDGQSMFKKLAKEEHSHSLILRNAYWNLSNRGVWAWSE